MRAPALVVGAGPTVLSAAYHLGQDALLIERNATVGGWCRSVFEALDLGKDACVTIGKGRLPPELKAALVERVTGGQRSSGSLSQRMRQPITTRK